MGTTPFHAEHRPGRLISLLIGLLACTLVPAQQFDHGTNTRFTPYAGMAAPTARETPLDHPPPFTGTISNLEGDITHKPIAGANSGEHFPKGTPGVRTVRYDLYFTDTLVNFTGKKRRALAVNGEYPAPTLTATIGDTLLV